MLSSRCPQACMGVGNARKPARLRPPSGQRALVTTRAVQQLSAAAVVPAPVDPLASYTLRPGQSPSSAPTPVLPAHPDSFRNATRDILLIRDTNAWCPFCTRVVVALAEKGLEHDTMLVSLYSKPDWYASVVPTTKVPAIQLRHQGSERIVWESKDILLALEEAYPEQTPLLPLPPREREQALALLEDLEALDLGTAGFAFLAGGPLGASKEARDPANLPALRQAFAEKLGTFEAWLAAKPTGPWLLGSSFSLLDIMAASYMGRLASTLPVYRGFSLRANPAFKETAAWLAALESRPSYQGARCDDTTMVLLMGRFMAGGPAAAPAAAAPVAAAPSPAASAAAAALQGGGKALVVWLLEAAGLERHAGSLYGATCVSANGRPARPAAGVTATVGAAIAALATQMRYAAAPGAPVAPGARALMAPGGGAATAVAALAFLASPAAFPYALGATAPPPGDGATPDAPTPPPRARLSTALQGLMGEAGWGELRRAAAELMANAYGGAGASVPAADGPGGWVSPTGGFVAGARPAAAREAAAKLAANRTAVARDMVAGAGLARTLGSPWGATMTARVNGHPAALLPAVQQAAEAQLERLVALLSAASQEEAAAAAAPVAGCDAEAAATGAAALAFLRNRVSSPRDMSAAAADELRAAVDTLLLSMYG